MMLDQFKIEFEILKVTEPLMQPDLYLKSLKKLKARLNRSQEYQTTKEQDQKIMNLLL